MSIRLGSSTRVDTEISGELLASGEPLVVVLDEIVGDGTIAATLLVDALHTPAGTRVTIAQAPGIKGRDSLDVILTGDEKIAPSAVGDVISFASAYVDKGIARVGRATAREHDGLSGHAQVITAMARASQSKVSKRGPHQSLTIADGDSAVIASSVDEVIGVLEAATHRKWPGGDAGLIMRDRAGGTAEYFLSKDYDIAYLAEELREAGTLDHGKLEVIPAWRVSIGRDQVARDIDPRAETSQSASGPVTRQFEHKDLKGRQGFVPCLIVLADEDEWAFKAKTGNKHRVAASVQPLMKRKPILAERLPSAVRAYGGKPNGVLELHDLRRLDENAAARKSRRPTVEEAIASSGARHAEDHKDEAPSRSFRIGGR